MGLDITAYRQLKIAEDVTFDINGEPSRDDCVRFYCNPDFPAQFDGLRADVMYDYADSIGVAAGSYGGYNFWRDTLAKLAGYPEGEYEQYGSKRKSYCVACWEGASGPFAELIHFSDCEGSIGPVVVAKLLADFDAFADRAKEIEGGVGRLNFAAKYAEWHDAFRMAADGGAISFH